MTDGPTNPLFLLLTSVNKEMCLIKENIEPCFHKLKKDGSLFGGGVGSGEHPDSFKPRIAWIILLDCCFP